MAEEKIIKINLRKQMKSIPKWRRNAAFSRFLKKRLHNDKLKISKNLNEKILSLKSPEIRLRIVKDDKSVRAEFVA